MKKAIVNLCRLLLAAVFILSGFVKAVDPLGTLYKMQDYLLAMDLGGWLPDLALLAFAVGLSALEFCLGIFMLFAIRRRLTSRTMVIVLAIMTSLTLWLALTDPISDCGCFGDALVLTNWQTFWKNIILLTAALVVAKWPFGMIRFISKSNQWIVINYSLLFILIISGWSLYDRPQFDFRPYHEGTDLREGWNLMMEGNESPYADFFIEKADDGEDITEQVLNNEGYTFLLIAPWLEKADDSQLDLINQVYEYAEDNDYLFYCLTASGESGISLWRDITGADYPFCQTDGTVLKTMIRSNPGLLLLKDGKVIRKWSHNRLPDEYDLARPLEELELGQAAGNTMGRHIAEVMLWFVLPLLLLSITDRLWMWSKWIRKRKNSNSINKKEVKMRKKIVAGNWKMNMNLQDGIALAKELNETLKAEKPNCGVVICTPFIHLASIAQFLDQDIIGLGAENCADKEKGAFTGEVSAEMVKSTGAQYVILGHSERREYYKETPEILKEKVLLAQKNDLKVIFCIGESLEEREAGKQNEVVKAELEGSVFNLSEEDFRKIVIAYEPIWAIGTGKTATAEQAEEIHAYIRSIIAEKYGQAVADDTTILYGGSCKASNAPELFAKPDIDGGLIGGASLKAADFKGIIDAFK
ncbi:triose-phosphate isomerase [Prevotella communis]|uniref:Triosephosphate isomerase n=1 Tax=Prevotella communis TaxID=2913614 RepID=A0A1G8AGD7_9BACT|nr:triose-phosphate isomerase [Prevotella communis]UKK56229.1 triose-phosphate isomerase [Prevotella communis]UKK58990.1 triose-phosphate isomerase [Prevotella communis]UKK66953.1 triose-phosphate isomerase [Prevotella communis]UKK70908.1 triose-phosphate isomerase [Prevotella communis]SDH20022.1 triosephosphate isomerase [Prevotella communis]